MWFVIGGSLLLVLGGLWTTCAWNLLFEARRKKAAAEAKAEGAAEAPAKPRWLGWVVGDFIKGIVWTPQFGAALIGALIMAGGGLLTTKGWNKQSADNMQAMFRRNMNKEIADRKRALARVLAAELDRNSDMIGSWPYQAKADDDLSKFVPYPTTENVALAETITSGLFIGDDDRELYNTMQLLYADTINLNDGVARAQQDIIARPYPKTISDYRRAIAEDPELKVIEERTKRVTTLLVRYGVEPNAVNRMFVKIST